MAAYRSYGETFPIISSADNLAMPGFAEEQAECFLIDAEEYRSVDHRIDVRGLKVYKFLYCKVWTISLLVSIVGLHCLAFIEFPSSLSATSVISSTQQPARRIEVPPALIFVLEAIFLIIILLDGIAQVYLFGTKLSRKNPWLITMFALMIVTWIDFFVSVGLGTAYFIRVRRFCRPFFAMQKSQLMKKVLKSLSKTVADIFSAFLLLALWLLAFTLISVSLFNGFEKKVFDEQYGSFYNALFTLLVLLTTANNPDSMIKVFNQNRLAFIFFVVFISVGIFVFMNVLIAIVFDEFRNHVLDSMQTSLFRRRLAIRAFYEVLRGSITKSESIYHDEVHVEKLERVIKNSNIYEWRKTEIYKAIDSLGTDVIDWQQMKFILTPLDDYKESKRLFPVPIYSDQRILKIQKFMLSKYFEIIGLMMCFANIIVIAIDVSNKFDKGTVASNSLGALMWIFIIFYMVEQSCKCASMGYRTYFSKQGCILEFIITVVILVVEIIETAIRFPRESIIGQLSVWDLPRIASLLILARTARVVLLFPSLAPILNTLFDIPWRMKPLIGLISLIFYLYALLGMNIFNGKINPEFMAKTNSCGTYQQLDYGGINFNDFYSSLVVLWCLLIVNNWHVFMDAFASAMGDAKITHLYMICWWIMSVIVILNCVTAFVIEAYSQRKGYYEEEKRKRKIPKSIFTSVKVNSLQYLRSAVVANNSFTFQMLFKKDLIEPTDEELLSSMKKCDFLCEQYPHIAHSYYESRIPSNITYIN